jgi:hypothetical protein
MRDRTNFEQLSPVEKARLVLPDVPLSDAMAANLALQLEFANTWREVAGTKIQRLLLKRIAKQAENLSKLVSQVEGDTLTYLTYESDACLPSVDRISSDLKRFSEQARRASNHKGGVASVKPPKAGTNAAPRGMFGRSPDYVFVIYLADIYFKYTGRPPGVCRNLMKIRLKPPDFGDAKLVLHRPRDSKRNTRISEATSQSLAV